MTTNKSYCPSSSLSKYVDRFYTFEQSGSHNLEPISILPGTGLELLIHSNTPLTIKGKELPKGHIICPRVLSHFENQNKVEFLSVRFKSGAFRHFTSIPFSELNNSYASVQDLWQTKGNNLVNRLHTISEISDKIQEIEKFLLEVFTTHHKTINDKWDWVIEELYYQFDTSTIERLSKKTNLSLRQFERNFKAQFGITAKEFQKLTRFQDVIRKIFLNKNPDYLNIALDNGYFDQSHFIKEFKSLTNKTPLQYFTTERFDSHFYHKSIGSNI